MLKQRVSCVFFHADTYGWWDMKSRINLPSFQKLLRGQGNNSRTKNVEYEKCSRFIDGRYCEEHRKMVERNYERYSRDPDVHKKYGRAWRRIRDQYVKAHLFCEECFKRGILAPVDEVHHIVPVSIGGTNNPSNLMSLCKSCHNKIHHEMGDW